MNAATRIEERFVRHREALLGFFRRRAPAREVEELAQETWFRVVRAAPICEDDRSFRAFLYTVARRLLVDRHRRNLRRPRVVPLDDANAVADRWGPEHTARAAQVAEVMQRELQAMKPELAEVFRWRTTEDVTFKEIAARQGVSVNTALGRMHQATKRVAAALRAAGLDEGGSG